MKELSGRAASAVGASQEECFSFARDVEAYPSWYPEVVRAVNVLERDASGAATRVRTDLHLSQGPLKRDFEVTMAVDAHRPDSVRLTRIPHDAGDEERFEVAWAFAERRIQLELNATLPVPRLIPLGGIGNAVAEGFVAAAVRRLGA
jgi:ribosome-associated toxin RatA of RatAB toxin-antitoxin module